MLALVFSTRFRRDVKKLEKRGKDLERLKAVIRILAMEEELSAQLKDHALRGSWAGYRDLHVEPDWLLIYRVEDRELRLARTGTHSDLFRE